jgi:prophage regulatory protein
MNALTNLVDESTTCKLLGGENTPIHRSTLWRGINEGRFPPPLKIGRGTNRWLASEINKYLEKAAEARTLKAGRAA